MATRPPFGPLIESFTALGVSAPVVGENLLEHTSRELAGDFAEAYGAKPATLWAEVQR